MTNISVLSQGEYSFEFKQLRQYLPVFVDGVLRQCHERNTLTFRRKPSTLLQRKSQFQRNCNWGTAYLPPTLETSSWISWSRSQHELPDHVYQISDV